MAGVGLGFVLDGDGIACIDLDHCLADGVPDAATERLLSRLPRTFIEISPSGDGLHVWGVAEVRRGRRTVRGGVATEVYGTGRYITVTGRRFRNSPTRLADLTEVLAAII